MKKSLKCIVLAVLMLTLGFSAFAEKNSTTTEQMTALVMLNYLTVLTQEINDSRNSRLFMEQAYSELINNMYPNSVDNRTQGRVRRLLDTMDKYRMLDEKREHLRYIHEQYQAQKIRYEFPDPLGMLSTAISLTPARLISSVVYMAADTFGSMKASEKNEQLKYLEKGWELEDEENREIHQSRKDMFDYMVDIANEYNFDGNLMLTEKAVKEFSRWKNDENLVARIQFLEDNRDTYQAYGGYWLTLAESHYNNGELRECIDDILAYEKMDARIFRRDLEYARVLPLAIAASEQIHSKGEYARNGGRWAEEIYKNTRNEDWALRYFAAQTYISIYNKTGRDRYLKDAYKIARENVYNLLSEQKNLNDVYLDEVVILPEPKDKDASKKREEVKKINEMRAQIRKKELTPASEALLLNVDLLFALADLAKIDDKDKSSISSMLHHDGARLFLNESADNKYWFPASKMKQADEIVITFGGTVLVLPVTMINDQAKIMVSVKEKGSEEPVLISDWKLDKVERKEKDDIDKFYAYFVSDEARKHAWGPESDIVVTVKTGTKDVDYEFRYTTSNVKTEWYEYVTRAFSGHKNEWYDYLKVWENAVDFDRIYSDGSRASEKTAEQ